MAAASHTLIPTSRAEILSALLASEWELLQTAALRYSVHWTVLLPLNTHPTLLTLTLTPPPPLSRCLPSRLLVPSPNPFSILLPPLNSRSASPLEPSAPFSSPFINSSQSRFSSPSLPPLLPSSYFLIIISLSSLFILSLPHLIIFLNLVLLLFFNPFNNPPSAAPPSHSSPLFSLRLPLIYLLPASLSLGSAQLVVPLCLLGPVCQRWSRQRQPENTR